MRGDVTRGDTPPLVGGTLVVGACRGEMERCDEEGDGGTGRLGTGECGGDGSAGAVGEGTSTEGSAGDERRSMDASGTRGESGARGALARGDTVADGGPPETVDGGGEDAAAASGGSAGAERVNVESAARGDSGGRAALGRGEAPLAPPPRGDTGGDSSASAPRGEVEPLSLVDAGGPVPPRLRWMRNRDVRLPEPRARGATAAAAPGASAAPGSARVILMTAPAAVCSFSIHVRMATSEAAASSYTRPGTSTLKSHAPFCSPTHTTRSTLCMSTLPKEGVSAASA